MDLPLCTWYPVSTAWLELRSRKYNTFDADCELSRRFGGSCGQAYRPGVEQFWGRSRHRNCLNRWVSWEKQFEPLLGMARGGDVASAEIKFQRRSKKVIVLLLSKRLGRVTRILPTKLPHTHAPERQNPAVQPNFEVQNLPCSSQSSGWSPPQWASISPHWI
jgi:hypothetical protein